MANARDTLAGPRVTPGVSSDTFSYTCTGTNRFLVVFALSNNAGNPITGITYNGVAMTKLGSITAVDAFAKDVYVLVNPASGANNIVITASGSVAIVSDVMSYTGVHQTTPTPTTAGSNATTALITGTLTVSDENSWLLGFSRTGGDEPSATGTNYVRQVSNAGNGLHTGDSGGAVGSGSKTMSVVVVSTAWGFFLVELKPAAGSTIVPSLASLGVGA